MVECQQYGEVLVAGDFNRYSSDGVVVGSNAQGVRLASLLSHSDLFPVSITDNATGPHYTYSSGGHFTTVDYILASATDLSQIVRPTGHVLSHSIWSQPIRSSPALGQPCP